MSDADFRRSDSKGEEARGACIWMTAGVVTYKLCDRRFDCDHCPLDAALTLSQASERSGEAVAQARTVWALPRDRLYGPGRYWLRAANGSRLRMGLDGFAARLLSRLEGLRLVGTGEALVAGDLCCAAKIAGGEVSLRAPIGGRVIGVNPRLKRAPRLLVTDPYGSGWIYDLETQGDALGGSVPAAAMRRRLAFDLRHFRRRVASFLLADSPGVGRVMADGGEPLTDLQQLLGREEFLRLLEETLS